jgi:hypothetical protein
MGDAIEKFIERWKDSGGSELANSQSFLKELCALLRVDAPPPTRPDDPAPAYAFERQVVFDNRDGTTSPGRIDLYKRGCFVLESKQGISTNGNEGRPLAELANERPQRRKAAAVRNTPGWDEVMLRARWQAEGYVRALPGGEGRPPFIVVVDVGHCLELYAEFSMTGGTYIHFPDPQSHRISLDDLRRPELRERLRLVWTDPLALDPSRRAAKVTREIAAHLAELAKSLEAAGHRPEDAAAFLMRCLFTMFAEDVNLLPAKGFARLLAEVEPQPDKFKPMAEDLWRQMKTGGFSSFLMEKVPHFNGYLFAEAWALELDTDQVALLRQAAQADWRDVEPAIFGTLLERALDPVERHKLGAHYTPRAYVERLVMPTIVEPLRKEWDGVQAAVSSLIRQVQEAHSEADSLFGKTGPDPTKRDMVPIRKIREEADRRDKEALATLKAFHKRLCEVKILDPACGTGNFLYVSLEHLKRLEGEVLQALDSLTHSQTGFETDIGATVYPHQFLGIEINPRAAAIAELVLWIGYLQWHFRTHGQTNPPEPIIRDFKNIECRDAVLAWDSTKPEIDPQTLKPKTRWDGRTYKKSPVTGEDIPDENARVLVEKYINPRKAKWPKADFVVGNPPFIGNKRMRIALGDGYVAALRSTISEVPESIDYVMYWWDKAAENLSAKQIKRFGFVTTNSITQTYNRKVIEKYINASKPISIIFAIPDHPWVDSVDGAAVRIAMTCATKGIYKGIVSQVTKEEPSNSLEVSVALQNKSGKVSANLRVGVDILEASILDSNGGLAYQGMTPLGTGFRIDKTELAGLNYSLKSLPPVVKPYIIGKDLTQTLVEKYIIDFFGISLVDVEKNYPTLLQRVLELVKPERDEKERKTYRDKWWLFAEPRALLRPAISKLSRYIVTCRTSRHRFFSFINGSTIPDAKVIAIALEDASFLGVLSSRIHKAWALATGAWLGVGNDSNYNHSECFGKFPFPNPPEALKAHIRELGERLEAYRKRQQGLHPDLTMTGMYNVLEKLRAGQELTPKERVIHEQGLVSVLKQIHDELDAAVFEAYGWPATLSDEEILERLVALNKERAAEEAKGLIRSGCGLSTKPPAHGPRCKASWPAWPRLHRPPMPQQKGSPGLHPWPPRPRPCAKPWRPWPPRQTWPPWPSASAARPGPGLRSYWRRWWAWAKLGCWRRGGMREGDNVDLG